MSRPWVLAFISFLCLGLGRMQAQTIEFTVLPVTAATENVLYTGNIFATIDNTDPLTYSAPVLPHWLTLASDGEGVRKVNKTTISSPAGVAMDAGNNVYVVQFGGLNIYKITPDGNSEIWAQRPSGNSYAALVIDNYLYVSIHVVGGGTPGIYRFDLNSAEPEAEVVQLGKGCISMTHKDGYLYAASFTHDEILKINLSTFQTTIYTSAPECFGLGFDAAGNLIIANFTEKKIVKYDPTSGTSTDIITGLPTNPTDVKIDAMGNLWVSFFNTHKIRKYAPDYASFVELGDPARVFSMSLTPAGVLVYGNTGVGDVYSLQTGVALTGTPSHADVGDHPVKIAVTNGTVTKEHEFVITVADPNPPVVSSYSPAVGSEDIGKRPTLSLVFNETIKKGSGMIVVVDPVTETPLQSFQITLPEISISGSTLTIPLTDDLPAEKEVAIVIEAGAVKDASDNNFVGIVNLSTWYFKTGISQEAQTISYAATRSVSYGTADFDPGASATSGLSLSYSSSDESIAKIVSGKVRVLKVGTVTITASQAGNDDYLPATSADQTLTVTPKEITVSMLEDESGNKVYDGNTDITLAAAAYTLNGVVGDDEVTVSGTTRFSDADAGVSKSIQVEDLVLSGADKDNYTLAATSTTAVGSISQAALVVVAEARTKDYGTADPALTYQVTGLLSGDEITGSLSRSAGNDAGDYDIIQGTLSAGNNYDVEYIGAQLTIKPVALKITSEAASKIYGAPDPVFSYTVEGLVDGDALTGALTREPGKNVGEYAILLGTLTGGDNYIVAFSPATLTITPAPLVIRAENKTRDAWQSNPPFTFIYSGFVGSDNASALSTQPTAQTAAGLSSPAGKYDILVSGAASANYTITYLKGELTVHEIDRRDLKVWQSGSQLHIRIFTEHAQKSRLTLFSLSGQVLITQRQNLQPGVNNFVMQVGSLAPTLYVLYLHADRFRESEQVRINK